MSIRLKCILLVFIFSHHIVLTTSATTNGKLLVAAGVVTTALMSSSFSGYYSWSPSAIALLTGILLIALIPTPSNTADTCTAPGYANDPVLGCIKFYRFSPSAPGNEIKAQCASDGGALLLVNSAEENTALGSLLETEKAPFAVIQGSRVTANDPWLTDSGQPLPYISFGADSQVGGINRILALFSGVWLPYDSRVLMPYAVCEIP